MMRIRFRTLAKKNDQVDVVYHLFFCDSIVFYFVRRTASFNYWKTYNFVSNLFSLFMMHRCRHNSTRLWHNYISAAKFWPLTLRCLTGDCCMLDHTCLTNLYQTHEQPLWLQVSTNYFDNLSFIILTKQQMIVQ